MIGALTLPILLVTHPVLGQAPKFNDAGNRAFQGLQKLDSLLNTPAGRLKVFPWTVGTGGFVQGRNPRWTRSFNLKRGVPFSLLLAGDSSVKTISCAVMNNATKQLEQQSAGPADNFTFTFTPPADGSYQIQVGIPGEVKPLSFVCCAFLLPTGIEVSSSRLGAMTGMVATTLTAASSGSGGLRVPPNFSFLNFGMVGAGRFVDYGAFNLGPVAFFGGTDVGRGGLVLEMFQGDRKTVITDDRGSDEIAGIALETGVKGGFIRLSNASNQDRMCFFAALVQ